MKQPSTKFLFTVILFSLLLIPQLVRSQISGLATVHFKKDKFFLTDEAKKTLDAFTDTLENEEVERILIKGYTDSDADSVYNQALSQRRCLAVVHYLIGKGIDSSKCVIAAYGEYFPIVANTDESNMSQNRRVELYLTTKSPAKNITQTKDPCTKDTMIQLTNGVIAFVNACAYRSDPKCLSITIEKRPVYKLKKKRLMRFLHLKIKHPYKVKKKRMVYYAKVRCTKKDCENKPMKLYMPTYEVKEKTVTFLKLDSATGTTTVQNYPKIKSLKKKTYAVLNVECGKGGAGNNYIFGCGGDYYTCSSCKPIKLVLKNGLKAQDATSYAGSEISISNDSTKVDFTADYGISWLLIRSGTDTISVDDVEFGALKHGWRHARNCDRNAHFLFIKYRKKCDYYLKYKLRKADLDDQKNKPWTEDEMSDGQ